MNIEPKYLAAIEVIHREGGLTRAAEKLQTSQPALSRLVSDLEIRLDAPIFDRSTRPWTLTKLGAALARQGASVLRAQDIARREIHQFKFETGSKLRIAGPQFFTDGVVTRLLPEFQHAHPDVSFEISYGYAGQLLDAVRTGRVDIAIFPRGVGEFEEDLTFIPLDDARNVVACRDGHPILKLAFPRPLALLDYGWIRPPVGSPLASDMEVVLADLDMHEARIEFSGGSPASVLSYLERSDCLTVLPESTVLAIGQLFGIRVVPIETRPPKRTLGILCKTLEELDNTSRVLVNFLRQKFQEGDENRTL